MQVPAVRAHKHTQHWRPRPSLEQAVGEGMLENIPRDTARGRGFRELLAPTWLCKPASISFGLPFCSLLRMSPKVWMEDLKVASRDPLLHPISPQVDTQAGVAGKFFFTRGETESLRKAMGTWVGLPLCLLCKASALSSSYNVCRPQAGRRGRALPKVSLSEPLPQDSEPSAAP